VGLFLCGLVGGALGGAGGSYVGGHAGGWIQDAAEEAYRRSVAAQGEPFPPGSEQAQDFWLGPPLF
jgi:hypothetical protein